MSNDEIQLELHRQIGGMFLSASLLLVLMDRQAMTIEELRKSAPAATFRANVLRFRRWMDDAASIFSIIEGPDSESLAFWKRQIDEAIGREEKRELSDIS